MKTDYVTNLITALEERYADGANPELASAVERMKQTYLQEQRAMKMYQDLGIDLPRQTEQVLVVFTTSGVRVS